MKRIYLLLLIVAAINTGAIAQLTGIKNIPGDYGTLALAITDLNVQGVGAGGVRLNLIAGNPQITPAGGYVIGNAGNILVGGTNPTAANPVIIEGNGNIITAFTPQASGNLNDAIFKIIGADYVTIQNFTMQENAANNTTAEATNNMTEWGVALLRVSATNGSQNNTIKNNTISLKRAYQNSFAVYSNVLHTATAVTILADITNVSGSNFGNKIYSNTISNTGAGIVFVGSSVAAQMDNGNDIGGSSAATGNTFTNWGGINVASAAYVSTALNRFCIFMNHQVNENVSYNTLTSAAVSGDVLSFYGIIKTYYIGQPSGTITSTINNNTITLNSSNVSGFMEGIINENTTALVTATFTMNNNTIVNCVINGAGTTSGFMGINNVSAPGILNISNNTIRGNSSSSAIGGFDGITNSGAVITTINITNNKIGDAIAGAIVFSAATAAPITAITNWDAAATATINLNNNSIQGISCVYTGMFTGIMNLGASGVAININNNQFGSSTGDFINSAASLGDIRGIWNVGGLATCTLTIQGNDIRRIVQSATGSGTHEYISNLVLVHSENILSNTFTNLSANTSGSIFFIVRGGNLTATDVSNCNDNSIVTAFNKTASGGEVYFFYTNATSLNGSTITQTGNNFSNVTVTGTTFIYGWYNNDGSGVGVGPTKVITGNTFSNITAGSGQVVIMWLNYGAATTCTSNTFSNITGTGDIFVLYHGPNNGQGTHSISSNNFSNISSTGAGGIVFGINGGSSSVPVMNINGNTMTGFSSTLTNAAVTAININNAATVNIYDNLINNLSSSGTTLPVINGIAINSAATTNVYKNRIYNLLQSGVISTSSPAINGILFSGGTTVTAYNNFISDLKATGANLADAVRGISITSSSASTTYNLYYNSVYINASSTGTNFGTSGIYHTTNATSTTAALNMIDNIIVNTSTANGTGVTAAFRRSGTALNNYAATSDHNLFYAGTPGPNKLIYYDGTNADQTLAAYQTRVSTRDANSISLMPVFVSATDLHLTVANCGIDGKGTPAIITTDIDGSIRDITATDIGGDEFTAAYNNTLAGVAGSVVCDNKTVTAAGTTYITNICDRIAKVLPSGGTAVSGKVNVCVTLDATQQYFNGEPYVKRHFDIEPAANPATSTATLTLYFSDAEFVAYNTANPAWPKLPTSVLGNADPNRANLRVTQFHGLRTTTPSAPGTYPGSVEVINPGTGNIFWNGTYWEITFNVTAFSGFYVHSTIYNTPLPIAVNYFNGFKQNGNHLLNWKVTCTNTPTATMVLERSTDGVIYNPIYTITATALQCQQPFNHNDAQPVAGMNYYRLKMTDANGKTTYSTIVGLLNASKGFDIMNIAPNPIVNRNFKLDISAAQKTQMDIVITDMQGRVMQRQTVSLIAGFNTIPVNVSNLSTGTYQVHGFTADGRSKALRFVIQ